MTLLQGAKDAHHRGALHDRQDRSKPEEKVKPYIVNGQIDNCQDATFSNSDVTQRWHQVDRSRQEQRKQALYVQVRAVQANGRRYAIRKGTTRSAH